MASSWGNSWKTSWGNSWGAITSAVKKLVGGVSDREKKRRSEIEIENENILAIVAAIYRIYY